MGDDNVFRFPAMSELMRELCAVNDRLTHVSLEVLHSGRDVGRMERMGKLITRSQELQREIIGNPWSSVTKDANGNWVLKP